MIGQPERKAVRLLIEGRVQGVWYRGWTLGEARARGLDGWVRNRRDGRVEAVFAGPVDEVDAMIQSCWQGPSAARVADVKTKPEIDPVAQGFTQYPTV